MIFLRVFSKYYSNHTSNCNKHVTDALIDQIYKNKRTSLVWNMSSPMCYSNFLKRIHLKQEKNCLWLFTWRPLETAARKRWWYWWYYLDICLLIHKNLTSDCKSLELLLIQNFFLKWFRISLLTNWATAFRNNLVSSMNTCPFQDFAYHHTSKTHSKTRLV